MGIEWTGKVFRVVLVFVSLVAIALVALYPFRGSSPAPVPEVADEPASVEVANDPEKGEDLPEDLPTVSMPATEGAGPVVGSTESYEKAAQEKAAKQEKPNTAVESEEKDPAATPEAVETAEQEKPNTDVEGEGKDSVSTPEPTETVSPEDSTKKADATSSTTPKSPDSPAPSSAPAAPKKTPEAAAKPTQKTPKAAAKPTQKPTQKATHYGNMTTIHAKTEEATTIRSVKGVGTIPVVITLDPKSTAPALPTYVLVSCTDRLNPYAGGYNTIAGQTTVKQIPYSGDCVVKVRSAYPTPKWEGKYNAIQVSTGTPTPLDADGEPYTGRAQWKSRPVASSSEFSMDAPAGFRGNVVMKVTACSTRGGATDKTASFACDGHINRTNSRGRIEVLNGGKVVATQPFDIELNKHHETFTIPVKLSAPDVKIRVVKTSGTSILVHGPGSSIVGVH